jgi:hypothetical protein
MKDRKDKIPELVRAARRARDDETALLLLQKAKEIDPANLELYRLRAEIFERIGDEGRLLAELRAAIAVDPTAWDVRYELLHVEYPGTRKLDLAAGIVRDLAWDRGFPPRLFNSSRGSLRSENELAFDQGLLGHLAYRGRPDFAPLEVEAVAAAPDDDLVLLVASEPWLLRVGPDGALRFGIDLWIAEERRGVERPADVAVGPNGTVYVADGLARCVRRFDAEGRYEGVFGPRGRAAPLAIACGGGRASEVLVLGDDAKLRRYDPRGKLVRSVALGAGAAGAGLAAGPDGAAYVVDALGRSVEVVGPRARKPEAAVRLGGGGGRAKKPARRGAPRPRRGVAFDAANGTILLADPAAGAIRRHDLRSGALLERIGGRGKRAAAGLRAPRDVAVTEAGGLGVADAGLRRLARRAKDGFAAVWGIEP